jgi:hypothetical protein
VKGIEFVFEGDYPAQAGKQTSFSVSSENEAQILDVALEAYRKRHPVEVYEDRRGKIVRIQPTDMM